MRLAPGPRCLALLALAAPATACGGDAVERPRAARAERVAVVREVEVAPRVRDLTVRSPALGATAKVRLVTPRGWKRGPATRRWPVLYLLHGCCDTYDSWDRETAVERLRALRDVLVVLPDGGRVGFYADWAGRGSEPAPAWETFHLRELRGLLERRYGAGPRRAVAGLSMGGLGAMGYVARNPGLFRAAASFSGLLNPLAQPQTVLGLLGAFTPDPLALWGDPRRDRRTWARHDPVALAPRLRGTPLFVSSGDGRRRGGGRDPIEQAVGAQSRAFVGRLRALRIAVRADLYGAGTHTWPYWERALRRALPTLLRPLRP